MTATSLEHMRAEELVHFPMDAFLASYEEQRSAVRWRRRRLQPCLSHVSAKRPASLCRLLPQLQRLRSEEASRRANSAVQALDQTRCALPPSARASPPRRRITALTLPPSAHFPTTDKGVSRCNGGWQRSRRSCALQKSSR